MTYKKNHYYYIRRLRHRLSICHYMRPFCEAIRLRKLLYRIGISLPLIITGSVLPFMANAQNQQQPPTNHQKSSKITHKHQKSPPKPTLGQKWSESEKRNFS